MCVSKGVCYVCNILKGKTNKKYFSGSDKHKSCELQSRTFFKKKLQQNLNIFKKKLNVWNFKKPKNLIENLRIVRKKYIYPESFIQKSHIWKLKSRIWKKKTKISARKKLKSRIFKKKLRLKRNQISNLKKILLLYKIIWVCLCICHIFEENVWCSKSANIHS